MNLEIQNINFNFYKISEHPLKNGDVNYFGFFTSTIFKSYGFLSQNQIEKIKEDFIVLTKDRAEIPKETVNFWTKSIALKEKKQFNLGFLFLIKENNKDALLKIKKYPFLQLVLSDQPEVFYNIQQKSFSYKKINDFRFSDFSFTADFLKKGYHNNSNCYKMKDFSSSLEVVEYLLGSEFPNRAKKIVMQNILHKRWGDIVVNYELIKIVFFLRKIFNNEFICYVLENHLEKILSCKIFKDIDYSGLALEKNYSGPVKYLNQFSDEKVRFRQMLRFNVPQHIFHLFSDAMGTAFDTLQPNVQKASDALYFFNNLSRSYGRLKSSNFPLKTIKKFKKEIYYLDGLSVGDFTYKVAKDYYTLVQWGSDLCNCAGNFHSSNSYKEMLMVGIFKNNKIVYLASVKGDNHKEIAQIEGFKNSLPNKELLKTLFDPFVPFLTDPEDNLDELLRKRKNIE